MTFFVFLVAGILHSSGNLSYLSGRGGLSSGKMKFLVQFAIRCECKRPLPLLDIEKREGQISGNEVRERERERERKGEPEIGSQRAKCIGRPNVICDTRDCPFAFFPVFFTGSFGLLLLRNLISRAIKSKPFEKEVHTFGSNYFHSFHAGSKSSESEQIFVDFSLHATSVNFISARSSFSRSKTMLISG